MKAVLLVPRLPGTGFTGDRLRAELHLAALAKAGYETAIVGGVGGGEEILRVGNAAAVHPVRLRQLSVPMGLASAAISGEPLQSALFAGSFDLAVQEAARGAELLVAVLLPRLLAHLRSLPALPRVVDYVDALSEAARRAAHDDPSPWRRAYWALEAPRLGRAEERAARGAAALLATTPADAASLPRGTRAVANGVTLLPAGAAARGPVVAFTGRLMYRPNRLAARRLIEDIWPRVMRAAPDARLLVGGADAPQEILAAGGRGGVEVVSPVADMPAFLRQALVVVAPVDLGTGTPNKLFEAFEAGAAVVASSGAIARAASSGGLPPARSADTDDDFARVIADYLGDPGRAADDGARGRAFVEEHADRRTSVAALADIYRAAQVSS